MSEIRAGMWLEASWIGGKTGSLPDRITGRWRCVLVLMLASSSCCCCCCSRCLLYAPTFERFLGNRFWWCAILMLLETWNVPYDNPDEVLLHSVFCHFNRLLHYLPGTSCAKCRQRSDGWRGSIHWAWRMGRWLSSHGTNQRRWRLCGSGAPEQVKKRGDLEMRSMSGFFQKLFFFRWRSLGRILHVDYYHSISIDPIIQLIIWSPMFPFQPTCVTGCPSGQDYELCSSWRVCSCQSGGVRASHGHFETIHEGWGRHLPIYSICLSLMNPESRWHEERIVHIYTWIKSQGKNHTGFRGSFKSPLCSLAEDLPELFLGKPRPYSVHDLEKGMQVTWQTLCFETTLLFFFYVTICKNGEFSS